MPILQTIDLSRTYQKGPVVINAVDDINLNVDRGELLSIVGRSGSGKSTLLNLIGGLDSPTSGKIIFNGKDISRWNRNELAVHRRYNVGMIFQSFNLMYTRNALENVMLALVFGGYPKRQRESRAIQLLEHVGLSERLYHRPDELSGGETQRVAIARALANDPAIILADEPTGNLDSNTATEIMDLLVELNRKEGKTILLVTHDSVMAEHISDRMIRLLDGQIVENREIPQNHEDR